MYIYIYARYNECVSYNLTAFFSVSFLHQPLYAPYVEKNIIR